MSVELAIILASLAIISSSPSSSIELARRRAGRGADISACAHPPPQGAGERWPHRAGRGASSRPV